MKLNLSTWAPAHGDIIHFRAVGARGLKTGRYRLESQAAPFASHFWLMGLSNGGKGSMSPAELLELEAAGRVTFIPPAELERDRQALQLRCAAPLRRVHIRQHDASDLALFRHAGQPSLF